MQSAAPKLVPSGAPVADSPEPPPVSGVRPAHAEADAKTEEAPLAMSSAAKSSPWVLSSYFAEGLPYSIVHQMSMELFTSMGVRLEWIGLTSAFGVPWNLKALWSPFVDGVGTTRRWMIALELALAVAVFGLALLGEQGSVTVFAAVFFGIAILGATHDMAVDGFYLRTLDKPSQTALSGVRIAAYRGALLVGKGALVWLAGHSSWSLAFAVAGALMLLLMLGHGVALPPEARSTSRGKVGFGAFTSFFTQPQIAVSVAFILTFRAGDAMMFAMSSPFLNELGWTTSQRGIGYGLAGTGASIAGSMLGASIIAKRGFEKTFFPIALVQSFAILLYVWMAWARPGSLAMVAVVVVEQLVAGIGTAALLVVLVRRCAGEHKVSHFAIASSLMGWAATAAGSASGFLASHLGFTIFFAIAFLASIPGVVLSRFAPSD
jgi:MFS transporter, PAT family, beta-lactamase induction signal transducer AmpG